MPHSPICARRRLTPLVDENDGSRASNAARAEKIKTTLGVSARALRTLDDNRFLSVAVSTFESAYIKAQSHRIDPDNQHAPAALSTKPLLNAFRGTTGELRDGHDALLRNQPL